MWISTTSAQVDVIWPPWVISSHRFQIELEMDTYFPRAKHSRVILEASMAVVSGNFTLMSAGYFLSPEGQICKLYQMLPDQIQSSCRASSFD